MKKLILTMMVLVAFIANATNCFAAAATVSKTEYGFSITGGTDATLIAQDTWATSTAYVVNQRVIESGKLYKCLIAHTSGTFATDLAAGKWVMLDYAIIWAYSIGQKAASATDASSITSGASDVAAFAILNTNTVSFAHSDGVMLRNPKITLANAGDIVYVYVKNTNF